MIYKLSMAQWAWRLFCLGEKWIKKCLNKDSRLNVVKVLFVGIDSRMCVCTGKWVWSVNNRSILNNGTVVKTLYITIMHICHTIRNHLSVAQKKFISKPGRGFNVNYTFYHTERLYLKFKSQTHNSYGSNKIIILLQKYTIYT